MSPEPRPPAPRTALCLQCRTALFEGEPCDADTSHTVASMSDVYGREALVVAVWGPVSARKQGLAASQRAEPSPWGALFRLRGRVARDTQRHMYPVGADTLDWPASWRPSGRGEVVGAAALESPACGIRCVAYALELHYEGYWGDRVMYRDAVTAGFTIALEGGGEARVPPGRIHLLGAMHQEIDVDNVRLAAHLKRFDPKHTPDGPFDPLRYNVVYERVLLSGDRIELGCAFEITIDPDAAPTHYRQATPSVLAPRGVPVVRPAADMR